MLVETVGARLTLPLRPCVPLRRSLLLFALICVGMCSTPLGAAMEGNCTTSGYLELKTDHMIYEIQAGHITAYPLINGTKHPTIFTKWMLTLLTERAKVTKTISGQNIDPQHVAPRPSFFRYLAGPLDPLEPHNATQPCSTHNSVPCGVLLQSISIDEMDCWSEQRAELFHGIKRQSAYIHFSHPKHKNFSLVASHHIMDRDWELPLNNSGDPITHVYRKGALKLGYTFINWPWSETDPAHSYTSLSGERVNNGSVMEFWSHFQASFRFPVTISLVREPAMHRFNLTALQFPMTLYVEIPGEYLMDGIGYHEAFNPQSLELQAEELDQFLQSKTVFDFPDAGHWDIVDYDPNIGVMFGSLPQKSPTPPPPANTHIGSTPKWVPIVVVLVIVAVLVAATVLVVVFVPPVKRLFRPFSKRKYVKDSEPLTPNNSVSQQDQQWAHSKTPTLQ